MSRERVHLLVHDCPESRAAHKMQSPVYTTVLSASSSSSSSSKLPCVPESQVNLLPFSLKYQGKAPISTYFQPQQTGSSTYASFRGRRVYSNVIDIPKGYTGYLISGPPKPSTADVDVASTALEGNGKLLTPAPSLAQVQDETDGLRRSPRKSRAAAAPIRARPLPSKLASSRTAAGVKRKFKLGSDTEDESGDEEARPGAAALQKPKSVKKETPLAVDEVPQAPGKPSPSPQPESNVPPPLQEDDETPSDELKTSLTLERHLNPTASFKKFLLWTPDAPWESSAEASGGADEFVKGLGEWRELDAEINYSVKLSHYDIGV